MSMTDQPSEPRRPVTRTDIAERGLDAFDVSQFKEPVAHEPVMGAVSAVFLPYVIEVAKLMSTGGDGVPEHCRANPGMCLRICFQAVQWKFEPYGVADNTFIINHRLGYMSQLVHAIVEKRAPLKHRLDAEYSGKLEDGTRQIKIIGTFRDGVVRYYTSPLTKDIKPKNSPLWVNDPDQQLFYYGVRAWARRWVPDILLGVYTEDDYPPEPLQQDDVEVDTGLHDRLAAAATGPTEGATEGHVDRELAQLAPDNQDIAHAPDPEPQPQRRPPAQKQGRQGSTARRPAKRASDRRRPAKPPPPRVVAAVADRAEEGSAKPAIPKAEVQQAADRAEQRSVAREVPAEGGRVAGVETRVPGAQPKPDQPRTVPQYLTYASDWINAEESIITLGYRWAEERALRNRIGMTQQDRAPLEEQLRERKRKLEAEVGAMPPQA